METTSGQTTCDSGTDPLTCHTAKFMYIFTFVLWLFIYYLFIFESGSLYAALAILELAM